MGSINASFIVTSALHRDKTPYPIRQRSIPIHNVLPNPDTRFISFIYGLAQPIHPKNKGCSTFRVVKRINHREQLRDSNHAYRDYVTM